MTDRLTDRPTDHATRSVTIGHIYVRSTAMRPNNTRISVLLCKLWHERLVYSAAVCVSRLFSWKAELFVV